MKFARLFLPVLFAMSLLFTQQAGTVHLLSHALEQLRQQNKHSPHSPVCEKCATYAQMGNALHSSALDFTPPVESGEAIEHHTVPFHTNLILAADARGPPAFLRKTA